MDEKASDETQAISFDDSGLKASLNFLHYKTAYNLKKLVDKPGNKLAYAHHLWASPHAQTIGNFWSQQLHDISWSPKLERVVNEEVAYLLGQKESKWLNEILRYLPRKHLFKTTIYLNLGYDNIVFGENVALNMTFHQFREDTRETIYYLIHELAHAGYVKYHPLPELWNNKTNRQLLKVIKYLTHLEGMGVQSAWRIRISEGGLLDNDYKVLLNETERTTRINQYFKLFNKLEKNLDKKVNESATQIYENMSRKERRLWYIAGCHMAQEIEKQKGTETLRKLVQQGSEEFFNTYEEISG